MATGASSRNHLTTIALTSLPLASRYRFKQFRNDLRIPSCNLSLVAATAAEPDVELNVAALRSQYAMLSSWKQAS
jgi:hypothetical protein